MKTSILIAASGIAVLAVALSSAVQARAAVLAYEGFSYAPGTVITGQNGGMGFVTPWMYWSGTTAVSPAGLSDPSARLVTSGSAAWTPYVNSPVESANCRILASPLGTPGTQKYFSFLLRPEGTVGAGVKSGYFGLVLGDANRNYTSLFVGYPGANVGGQYCLDTWWGGAAHLSNTPVLPQVPTLLVVKANFASGVDTFSLYANPLAGGAEPSVPSAVKADLDVGTINTFSFAGAGAFTVDEIRVGDTYADVTPSTVPEPSTLALLGVGALGFMVCAMRLGGTQRCSIVALLASRARTIIASALLPLLIIVAIGCGKQESASTLGARPEDTHAKESLAVPSQQREEPEPKRTAREIDSTGPRTRPDEPPGPAATEREAVLRRLEDKDAQVRFEALGEAGNLVPAAIEAIPSLIEMLKDPSPQNRWAAALLLGKLAGKTGSHAGAAVKALTEMLENDDGAYLSSNRVQAAASLGAFGPDAKPAVPSLTKALDGREYNLRRWAARSLKQIGPEAKAAIPKLRHIAETQTGRDQADALAAIRKIGVPNSKELQVRYGIAVNLAKYPQNTPADALRSVIKAGKAGELDYAFAQLVFPFEVDEQFRGDAKKLRAVLQKPPGNRTADQEMEKELTRHLSEGKWTLWKDLVRSEIGKHQSVSLERIEYRWFLVQPTADALPSDSTDDRGDYAPLAPLRQWSPRGGNKTVKAELVECSHDEVRLRSAEGREFPPISWDELSDADCRFLTALRNEYGCPPVANEAANQEKQRRLQEREKSRKTS